MLRAAIRRAGARGRCHRAAFEQVRHPKPRSIVTPVIGRASRTANRSEPCKSGTRKVGNQVAQTRSGACWSLRSAGGIGSLGRGHRLNDLSGFSRRFDVRIVSLGGQLNLTWKRRMEQIRQRWWVVVVVAALGLLAAAASSLSTHPTYVGKSTLVLAGRAPEQDAVMVVGYMTIFNDPATITRLRTTTKIPEDVTFEARTVAASPILTIEATADDPKVAQDAAYDMAEAFRDDINAVQQAGSDGYIAELERQLAEIPPLDPVGATNAVLRLPAGANRLGAVQS